MKADYEELYDLKHVKKQSQSFDFAQDRFFIVHRSAFRVLRGSYCVRQFLPMAQEIATALRASQ
jgi:hypothetical protein